MRKTEARPSNVSKEKPFVRPWQFLYSELRQHCTFVLTERGMQIRKGVEIT